MPYWTRGAIICVPILIMFLITWTLIQNELFYWALFPIITVGSFWGILIGGFIGSLIELIKKKNKKTLIVFMKITFFIIAFFIFLKWFTSLFK